jgi:hypothetical protein
MTKRNPLREISGLDDDEFNRQQIEGVQFIQATAAMASIICTYDGDGADAMIDAWGSYDTMVSMFDPSRYMMERDTAHKNAKMVHIVREAQKKLQALGLCP